MIGDPRALADMAIDNAGGGQGHRAAVRVTRQAFAAHRVDAPTIDGLPDDWNDTPRGLGREQMAGAIAIGVLLGIVFVGGPIGLAGVLGCFL
ncbi:hypothetical protein [Sphingomonas sp. ID0503]|uniref:hypothetical protein n=1 Tax=Sphingomonas sp. ID0503 TaxID=3399691 RepID=UPI003AFA4398